jgi:hypothetical protein
MLSSLCDSRARTPCQFAYMDFKAGLTTKKRQCKRPCCNHSGMLSAVGPIKRANCMQNRSYVGEHWLEIIFPIRPLCMASSGCERQHDADHEDPRPIMTLHVYHSSGVMSAKADHWQGLRPATWACRWDRRESYNADEAILLWCVSLE